MRARVAMAVLACAACGSEPVRDLPPPAVPPSSPPLRTAPPGRVVSLADQPHAVALAGRLVVVLAARERVLSLYDATTGRRLATAPAGIGPTHVAVLGDYAFVADTRGGTLLVFSLRPRLQLVRRANLRGGPYGLALDPSRRRLWVTLTARNELVAVTADRRPRVLRRLPTVRQPDGVMLDPRSGLVVVTGRDAVQVVSGG